LFPSVFAFAKVLASNICLGGCIENETKKLELTKKGFSLLSGLFHFTSPPHPIPLSGY